MNVTARINAYHIQGMLEKTQSPLFSEYLIYGEKNKHLLITLSNFTPSYNGNISAKKTVARLTPDDATLTSMQDIYHYDQLDRLKDAYHSGNNGSNFSVRDITYDLQGNILSLTRYGLTSGVTAATAQREYGVVNQIVNGTKGHIIVETQNENSLWPTYGSQTYLPSGSYDDNTFDHNGNLTFDEMRETSFKYNHLNLSTKITNPGDTMLIQYDALGNKVRQISGNDTLYFVGGAIYECKMQSAECKMQILTENGYIKDGMYHYFVKDYLGNNRLVLNEYGMIMQKNNYYPFGMSQLVDAEQQDGVPYKFSGKELESEGGLNWYDFSARFYDASTGRFGQIDPMAEKYYPISPYAYCGNNPTRFVDPTGMYSTEEWMRDNNITDEDLIRIYTAPDEESETTTNDGDDGDESGVTVSTTSTVFGTVGTVMQQSSSSVSIPSNSTLIPPHIYPNGLWSGNIMFGGTTLKVASIGKLLGNIGIGLGMYSLYTDYKQWGNGNMSNFRLGYRTATFGVSWFGIVGALGSMLMYGAEVITDKVVVPANKSVRQLNESFKNPNTWGQMYGY